MSDDNNSDEGKVTNIDNNNKKTKDPFAKLREQFDKEWAPKLEAQRKKTVDAIRIANNEKRAMRDVLENYEEDRTAFNKAIKDVA